MAETGHLRPQEGELIYALDIGTRSVIGMLALPRQERVEVIAVEKEPHAQRAMADGQIQDIAQVARTVGQVTARLEEKAGCRLERACVAAAGRSLRTETGAGEVLLPAPGHIGDEEISRLEAAAVADAEDKVKQGEDPAQRLFLVGHTVRSYLLDGYPMPKLRDHTGQKLQAEVVATFLPGEVVDSLYAVMRLAHLEVASLTLEPIAALNAAIPADLRLLNLALVDIGAGTSDIAVCRRGSVVGYTMATVAGDEITEAVMQACLVDYQTAETMKAALAGQEPIRYVDILGLEQTIQPQQLLEQVGHQARGLAEEIAKEIQQLNGGAPAAVFLAGGGSKLAGLCPQVAQELGMDPRRVAVAGAHFKASAFSQDLELGDPEYTTPLGIAISAGLGLVTDSYQVTLNGKAARLFREGVLTVMELLMMNGYTYEDLLGRNGRNLLITLNGRRTPFFGTPAQPAELTVNGRPAQISLRVQAGDQIQFTPAQPGEDVQVTVGDLLARHGAARARVNGEPAGDPDTLLRQGDRVELWGAAPAEDPEDPRAADEPLSGGPAAGDLSPAEAVPPAEAVSSAGAAPTAEAAPPAVPAESPSPAPAGLRAEAVPPAQPAPAGRSRRFQLNGAPLLLPPKASGQPYYLMDLLEHSGIDFDHLDRPVRLRVNGADCTFQQILNDGDEVEILCERE